jgi:restriction system protein
LDIIAVCGKSNIEKRIPMSAREAAIQVLSDAGEPLHSEEITKRILANRLWETAGKTPSATVEAQICTDMQRKGDASPFVRTAPRTFGLRSPLASRQEKPVRDKPHLANEPSAGLSFTEAAEKILNEFGHKSPMHYREITAKAIQQGWISTSGKTPQASMYSQLITEIRRDKSHGRLPRFVQHGKGYFGLSRWMGRGLAFEIEQHNRRVRQKLHSHLLKMEPSEFEELIGRLLAELGFEGVEVTRRSGDGGIDVRGTLVVGDVIRTQMAVQVKRWKTKTHVQAPVVQQVRGSLGTHEQGLIITTSDFSVGAKREAERSNAVPVALMNGDKLVELLAEHQVGIKREAHDLFEMEEEETDPGVDAAGTTTTGADR